MHMMSSVAIRRSEVPRYLHESELYLSFDETDDVFLVPNECIKMRTSVDSLSDLRNILLTMRFWILQNFSSETIKFIVFSCNADLVVELLSKFESAFPGVHDLVKSFKVGADNKQACNLSAKFGRIDFLEFFVQHQMPLNRETLRIAAENGHTNCLAYCYDLLRSSDSDILIKEDWKGLIVNSRFDCLPFLVEHGVPVTSFFELAMHVGNAKCLKYLHETFHFDCWGPSTMAAAASAGQLQFVTQLHEMSCPWDESAPTAALHANNPDCLEYLLLHKPVPETEEFLHYDGPYIYCHLVIIAAKVRELPEKMKKIFEALKEEVRSDIKVMLYSGHIP